MYLFILVFRKELHRNPTTLAEEGNSSRFIMWKNILGLERECYVNLGDSFISDLTEVVAVCI